MNWVLTNRDLTLAAATVAGAVLVVTGLSWLSASPVVFLIGGAIGGWLLLLASFVLAHRVDKTIAEVIADVDSSRH